jgi:F420-non-reducing hydrogenase large subunit
MASLVFPLSRIEGHARVTIEEQAGEVVSARLEATELRGFQYLVHGVPAGQMPVIVPRICGVCSTAHLVAAVKTLEDIYGITPPPVAEKIRELMMLGQLIQNQATSLFLFTMPDRLGLASLFQLVAEQEGPEKEREEIASHALLVRKAGTDLIAAAGGQFIHPVKAVVGGVTSGIDGGTAEAMRTELGRVLPLACQLFDYYIKMSLALRERIGTWGDDEPAYYIASTGKTSPAYNSNVIHVMNRDGIVHDSFSPHQFRGHLTYEETEYSYAAHTSYQGQVMRANSLARINMAESMGTPLADGYLKRFRQEFGRPAHAILLFDLCRGIELVYALERAKELLEEQLDLKETAVTHIPGDGEGYGLVEAPRGPLIHHYAIEDGLISKAEFIIPTVHNMLAIERALTVAARRYITAERVNLELERAVGRVVRAFDPCIACATH